MSDYRYGIDELASVTVTYQPDMALLGQQLSALDALAFVIWVDNGSPGDIVQRLREMAACDPRITFIEMGRNAGLAAALNRGIAHARDTISSCRAVLLLDQDSTFAPHVPADLLQALADMESTTGLHGCVGPALYDPDTGMPHGFHFIESRWKWARAYPPTTSRVPFAVANLNGSGTTMSLALVDKIGTLDDSLFIDHVDTDWSFRVTAAGLGLYGIPWVRFDHRMGEKGRRVWFLGWRVWPERSPLRHYYLFRNTLRLIGRSYVPSVWKIWAVAKLLVTAAVVAATDPRRGAQLRMMWRGIIEGWAS